MHAKVASDLAHVVSVSEASVMAGGELLGLQDMFPRMESQKLQVPESCHRLNSSPSIGIDLQLEALGCAGAFPCFGICK